jgi:hypothetical protein
VVITALLSILEDQSLSSQHHTVIEAVMSIFKTQGLKCVTFLPQASEMQSFFTNKIAHSLLSLDHTSIRCRDAIIYSQIARIPSAAAGNSR